jgi:glutaryl-CoA dehydrogenase
MNELGEVGFLGVMTSEQYGGSGLGYVAYGLIARGESNGSDSGYRSAMSVQNSLVMHPIEAYGSPAQKQRYLRQPGQRRMGRLLRAERAGSRLRSRLDEDEGGAEIDGGYRLNGSKMWITNSPIADVAVVWAKLEERAIRGFVLERDMPGFSTPKILGKLSLRASVTGEIVHGRRGAGGQPAARRQGSRRPVRLPQQARYGIAWGAMGAAEDCWHGARILRLERRQFGDRSPPISSFRRSSPTCRRDRARPSGGAGARPRARARQLGPKRSRS